MKELRIFTIIIFAMLAILMAMLVAWCVISPGRVMAITDETGQVVEGSISEKSVMEINGAYNGFFIRGRDIQNPVLLFISSGPGTDDYFFNEKYPDMHLEDLYTVVYWDYRGMGIAYDPGLDPKTITEEVLLADTKAVTDYLKERFHKDKIYLMGFSGGTNIGLMAAKAHPEDYFAYIGMAQVVTDSAENDSLIYYFMKDVFTRRNDKKRLAKLEKEVEHLADGQVKAKNWYSFVYLLHEAGGGTTYNETEFTGIDIPIMLSRCYTVTEKINYIRGMKMYRKTTYFEERESRDYRDFVPELEIPVFFLSGEYDYNCPWPLVKEYASKIAAPDKEFYLISGAAHSPLWENSGESYEAMRDILDRTRVNIG